MVKSNHWPPQAQRSLLKWLDDHKGPQSPLIQDPKEGLRQLKDDLVNELKEQSIAFTKRPSLAQIERKLKSLWADRLGSLNLQSSDIQVLYEQGLVTLDWNKLAHKPAGRAYSTVEIEALKKKCRDNAESSKISSNGGVADDQQANGKKVPASTILFPDSDTSSDEGPKRGPKRRRLNNGSQVQREGRHVQGLGSRSKDGSREQPNQGDGTGPNHTRSDDEPGTAPAAPPASNMPRSTVTSAASNLPAPARAPGTSNVPAPADVLERTNNRGYRRSGSATRLPNEHPELHEKLPVHLEYHSNDEEAGAPEFAWNHFIDRFNHAQVYSQTDPALIAEDVESMMHEVQGVVLSYTLALGISSRQPAYLDGELRYPPECRGILESVVGALGAVGVDEEYHHADLVGGDIQRVFEKAFDLTLQEEIRRRLWLEHVSTHLLADLGADAHRKAATLQHCIDLLMPEERTRPETDTVISLPGRDPQPQEAATSRTAKTAPPDALRPTFNADETRARMEFHRDMAAVFKRAMRWRVVLSTRLYERYVITWPFFKEKYLSDQVWHKGAADADRANREAEGAPARFVLLGLRPIIFRATKKDIGARWSTWEVVSKGQVIPL